MSGFYCGNIYTERKRVSEADKVCTFSFNILINDYVVSIVHVTEIQKNKPVLILSCIEVYLNLTCGDQVVNVVKSFFDCLPNRHQSVIPQNQHLNTHTNGFQCLNNPDHTLDIKMIEAQKV